MTEETPAYVHLDHNAAGVVARECLEAMRACLRPDIGNPSSKHTAGVRAHDLLREARAEVAALIGAAMREIVFTSSGTEANHMAILGVLGAPYGARHVVTSQVEHPSTLMLLRHLEGLGARVTYLPVDNEGRLAADAVRAAITTDTALVTLMWANNETGVLFPIPEIAAMTRAMGVVLHVDAVQAAGRIPIDLARLPVDMLSLSGHKLHAPPGAGALFARKGIEMTPLLWGHQERARRGGSENLPAIVGFGSACALAREDLEAQVPRMERLRDGLEQGIAARFPAAQIHGAAAPRLPNTSSVGFGALDGERLMQALDRRGIAVSLGAACAAGGTGPSHVLMAMGLDRRAALGTIRFSLGRYNTSACIERVLTVLPDVLRDMSARAA